MTTHLSYSHSLQLIRIIISILTGLVLLLKVLLSVLSLLLLSTIYYCALYVQVSRSWVVWISTGQAASIHKAQMPSHTGQSLPMPPLCPQRAEPSECGPYIPILRPPPTPSLSDVTDTVVWFIHSWWSPDIRNVAQPFMMWYRWCVMWYNRAWCCTAIHDLVQTFVMWDRYS